MRRPTVTIALSLFLASLGLVVVITAPNRSFASAFIYLFAVVFGAYYISGYIKKQDVTVGATAVKPGDGVHGVATIGLGGACVFGALYYVAMALLSFH